MALTRRELVAAMAAATVLRTRQASAQRRGGGAMRLRATPAVCLYSRVLVKIPVLDLPGILQVIGFDGVDLAVQTGGHISPDKTDYNLMPALEAFTGNGLDVPMLTTDVTSLQDKNSQQILGLATYIGVPFFRPGHWKVSGAAPLDLEAQMALRDMAGLAQLGRATQMAMGVHNYLQGSEGATVADLSRLLHPLDPQWVGFDFDAGYATMEGLDDAMPLALTRLKMVTVRDFKWEKPEDSARRPKPCPLGDGVVDFEKVFAALARIKFAGPISIQVDHSPDGELEAVKHDLAFVRKQIAKAYG